MFVLKGEDKKRNKERKFKSDIENENELNADDKLAGHALVAQSTVRKHAASFSLQPLHGTLLFTLATWRLVQDTSILIPHVSVETLRDFRTRSNTTCKSSISQVEAYIHLQLGINSTLELQSQFTWTKPAYCLKRCFSI